MSYATKSSLDLLENARTGKKHGSLFWLLDKTKTAMGMRLLRTWIDRPLVNQGQHHRASEYYPSFLGRISLSVVT